MMLSCIPDVARTPLVIVAAAVGVFVGGYSLGHSHAAARGEAVIAKMTAAQADKDRAAAEEYGKAVNEALTKYEAEVERGNGLAASLSAARAESARLAKTIRQRIADATRSSHHTFSPDFVSLYNDAIGAIPENAVPAALRAPGPAGKTGNRTTPGSGVLPGVTEADLLAHIAYYGERCKRLEVQNSAFIDLAGGWK